jgi:hypothetical protein
MEKRGCWQDDADEWPKEALWLGLDGEGSLVGEGDSVGADGCRDKDEMLGASLEDGFPTSDPGTASLRAVSRSTTGGHVAERPLSNSAGVASPGVSLSVSTTVFVLVWADSGTGDPVKIAARSSAIPDQKTV